jgi:plasmid stabilization system protein ParE
MRTVHVTHRALTDLDAVLAYVAAESPVKAAMVNDRFLDAFESLSNFPERCPLALESESWERPVRSLLVYRYRVLFEILAGRVVVLRVVHGARLPLPAPDHD